MSRKNKAILTKTISFLIPIIMVIGLSCFFFIEKDWDGMTFDKWRLEITTWIITYGSAVLFFTNAILTSIKAKRILFNPILKVNKELHKELPIPDHFMVEVPKNKRSKVPSSMTFKNAENEQEYLRLKSEMAEYLEKIRKELKI